MLLFEHQYTPPKDSTDVNSVLMSGKFWIIHTLSGKFWIASARSDMLKVLLPLSS